MESKELIAARKARALYARSHQGILSTLSLELPGFPFGSVVTFAPDAQGRPLMQISRIAEHTRNIDADPRVSLILTEGGDDAQAAGRLTLVGRARPVTPDEADSAASRYFARFPHAVEYQRAHDFTLYVIEPLRIRYIGGFGQIHWLEPALLCRSNPFNAQAETAMTTHMNDDHASALCDYCRMYGIDVGSETPRLSAIDADGFDLMLGRRLVRIGFDTPVANAGDVRKAMVALALKARELLAESA